MKVNSDYVRQLASESYIRVARQRGQSEVSIPVKELETELKEIGLENNRVPLICAALRGNKFQKENGIVLERLDGPPSGQSPTVVFHFRISDQYTNRGGSPKAESHEQRALRLTEKLRGILKEEISDHGGAENFLRWVRSNDEDAA